MYKNGLKFNEQPATHKTVDALFAPITSFEDAMKTLHAMGGNPKIIQQSVWALKTLLGGN